MSELYVYSEGKKYLHYSNWERYRQDFSWNNPRRKGHFRIDFELIEPDSKPPSFWYACDEWVAIDVHEGLTHPNGKDSLRLIVESSHDGGERMIIYNTFSCLWEEPWGRNKPEAWIFFRGKMWKVSHKYLMMGHDWKFRVTYPLTITDHNHNNWYYQEKSYDRDDFLPETFSREDIHPEIAGFLNSIYYNPKEELNWLVLADWLEDRQDPMAEFIRNNIQNIAKLDIQENIRRPRNYRTLRVVISRLYGLIVSHPSRPLFELETGFTEHGFFRTLTMNEPPDTSLIAI